MAKQRKTRATSDTEAPMRVRLEVARASTLRLSVRATTKRDELITVSITLLVDEYRRLMLWQYLHRDDCNSISMATRHLLARQLPDDLIILRRRHIDASTQEPEGDPEVEELPTGALRAMPRPIVEGDAVTKFRVGLLKEEHLKLMLWHLEHSTCLDDPELGSAVRHLIGLSLADEDLCVGRRKKLVPAIVAPPAIDPEGLRDMRQRLGLPATMPAAA